MLRLHKSKADGQESAYFLIKVAHKSKVLGHGFILFVGELEFTFQAILHKSKVQSYKLFKSDF